MENRPGAGSMLAPEVMVRSAPDGYTLLVANVTIAMPAMFKKLSVRRAQGYRSGVGHRVRAGRDIRPSLAAREVGQGDRALAKRKPGTLNYGSAGTGAFTHMAMALFESMANIQMTHVPYKGSSQAVIGVTTGEVDLVFSSPAAAIGLVKQGRLRAIAVSGSTRSSLVPDVPTMAEAGIAGYDATSWYGLLAPAATPRAAISEAGRRKRESADRRGLEGALLAQAIDPAKGGVEEFAKLLAAEIPKWEKVDCGGEEASRTSR